MDPITTTHALDQQPLGGRYRLTDFIKGGGMGQVYRAEDLRLANKVIAIKILTQGMTTDPVLQAQFYRRFEQEAQLSAVLGGHPRIIQVTDYGVDNNQPFIAMEYLDGKSLAQVIQQEAPLQPDRVVRLALQLCDGLHYAHTLRTTLGERSITGVIHRDIKPSNIFVLQESSLGETVKILDFGIAKALTEGTMGLGTAQSFLGTADYASPEQLKGQVLDGRSDLYSLALILYEMLTGTAAIQPETYTFPGWYQAHNFTPARPVRVLNPQVPEALSRLIERCLAKDREERPADLLALRSELLSVLNPTTVATLALPPAIVLDVPPLPTPKNTPYALFAAVILAALIGVTIPFLLPKPTKLSPNSTEVTTQPKTQVPAPSQPSPEPTPQKIQPSVIPDESPAVLPRDTLTPSKPTPPQKIKRPITRLKERVQQRLETRTPVNTFEATEDASPDCYDPVVKQQDYRCRNRKN